MWVMYRFSRIVMLILITVQFSVSAFCGDTYKIQNFAPAENAQAIENPAPVKNIIIMIGDGMGFDEVTAARIARFGGGKGLAMDAFPAVGISLTYSADENLITDSAAGATALASGLLTYNGAIGVDTDQKPVKTILEVARELGKTTGVVATCEITHATPAGFLSHTSSRGDNNEIALQIAENPADVMLAGGYGFFLPSTDAESYRKDDQNLIEKMKAKGRKVLTTPEEFAAVNPRNEDQLIGFFARKGMDLAPVRRPSLPEMTKAAIDILSKNEKGFFLMVEGSQIDWRGHDNDFSGNVDETIDFDNAVRIALNFARSDGNTLLIVTADHETGGLSVTGVDRAAQTVTGGWTTKGHSANDVPLYAFGPNAYTFSGTHFIFNIPQLAIQGWGVKNFADFARQ